MVPTWIIALDVRNHIAAIEFISTLIRKHLDTLSHYYTSLVQQSICLLKEVESKRTYSTLYIDFLTCTKILPRFKVFQCLMLAHVSR